MYKISVYIPESHVEAVKGALFAAGAGKIGHYDQCAWTTAGTGQFRPLPGNNAYTGKTNELQQAPECLVEMVCVDQHVKSALRALIDAHPYETPAYGAWRILQFDDIND